MIKSNLSTLKLIVAIYLSSIVYFCASFQSETLNFRDEEILLGPLKSVKNASDYFEGWRNKSISDTQPIRDLSYIFDIYIAKIIKSDVIYYLGNTLYFSIIIALFILICDLLTKSKSIAYAFGVVIFLHPCWLNIVPWISSRKHLLAAIFFLVFLKTTLQNKNEKKSDNFFSLWWLLCSWLSHPISIIAHWPISLFTNKITKRNILFLISILILSLSIFYLNYHKYGNRLTDYQNIILQLINSIAMTYNQIFTLNNYALVYSVTKSATIIGIIMFFTFSIIIFLSIRDKKKAATILYAVSILTITTFSRFFYSDSYVIIPLICTAFLVAVIFEELKQKFERKYFYAVIAILATFYTFRCLQLRAQILPTWGSQEKILEHNLTHYPSIEVKSLYAGLLANKDITRSQNIINAVTEEEIINSNDYYIRLYAYVYSEIILANPNITPGQKVNILKSKANLSQIFAIYQILVRKYFGLTSDADSLKLAEIVSNIEKYGRYKRPIKLHLKKICKTRNETLSMEDQTLCEKINLL
jgi:hypothetical protein